MKRRTRSQPRGVSFTGFSSAGFFLTCSIVDVEDLVVIGEGGNTFCVVHLTPLVVAGSGWKAIEEPRTRRSRVATAERFIMVDRLFCVVVMVSLFKK